LVDRVGWCSGDYVRNYPISLEVCQGDEDHFEDY